MPHLTVLHLNVTSSHKFGEQNLHLNISKESSWTGMASVAPGQIVLPCADVLMLHRFALTHVVVPQRVERRRIAEYSVIEVNRRCSNLELGASGDRHA